ncbi:MAG: EamA-like transporter family protein [Acidobacteria bacterium]|nr:EamA-like transporter family protein [Acidobacteriota bacterium]
MTWLLIPFVVFVGALVPLQAGVNASLRGYLSSPILAAVTNFSVGGLLLAGYALATREGLPAMEQAAKAPWWCWAGGAMGATLVLTGVLTSHRLGAGTFMACVILGQLAASVLLDHFALVGYSLHPVNPMRLFGIGLLAAGVYVVRTN